MFLRTPIKKQYDNIHTPPSGSEETILGGPTRKFLRSLRGKSHLSFEYKSQKNSVKTPNASPAFKSEIKRRNNLPKPLNLSDNLLNTTDKEKLIIDRQQNYQRHNESTDLSSPSKLTQKVSTLEVKHEKAEFGYEISKNTPLIMPVEDKMHSNQLSLKSDVTTSKKYINHICCICDEHISTTFLGEKTIDFYCGHISHYECYLIVFEDTHANNKYPTCRLCGADCEPLDEDIISDMKSRILTSKKKKLRFPELNFPTLNSAISQSISDREQQNTPVEKIINSAQVSSSGFKSSPKVFNPFEEINLDDENDSEYIISSSATSSIIINGLRIDLEERIDEDNDWCISPIVTRSGFNMIDVYFPTINSNDFQNNNCDVLTKNSIIGSPTDFNERSFRQQLRSSIDNLIFKDSGSVPSGELLMISQFAFSTNGEFWMNQVTVVFFSTCLIFYDNSDKEIKGNLPIDQISSAVEVTKSNHTVLVIELMSCSLPQVYLRCDEEHTNATENIQKWAFYLNNVTKEFPTLLELTDCSISVMPIELSVKYEQEVLKRKITYQDVYPWEISDNKKNVCIILCLSRNLLLNSASKIKAYIKTLLDALAPNDTLGILSMGKNGKGERGPHGTFVGPVTKYWNGWDSILNDIEREYSSNHFYNFTSQIEEYLVLFDTCYRIISTISTHDSDTYRELVILGHGECPVFNVEITRENEKVKKHYDFVTLKSHFNIVSRIIDEPVDIKCMRNWDISNIILKYDQSEKYIWLGHMHYGDKKSMCLTVSGPENVQLEWYDNNTESHHVQMYNI
ncbi:cyclin-dependent protein serine/threonine kinase inhibiting protein FAR1 RNJ42_00890 [Nakaseomyces bracarensis]|uniref:cyclin-dependent protein serine/threonine kinase inhibiting protein FAR1 n=1 Tax=Nakaseomyces bracarensis TaxID=273131 RepID=UPI003872A467